MTRLPLVTAFLVRNELGRYLKEVLDWHAQWSPLVILDDNSTDGTYEYCREHPAVVRCERRAGAGAWGTESPARALLWCIAAETAEWHLVCDADQLLSADPRPLTGALSVNAWNFLLYDLWGDRTRYREDSFWQGHRFARPWLVAPHRVPIGYVPRWSGRGIHAGHLPSTFPLQAANAPPETYYWLHLGYIKAEDREAKLAKYRSVEAQLTDFERAHAESIADPSPTLRVLPFAKAVKILVGGSVRKDAVVLKAHLASLAAQELPPRVKVEYAFVNDFPEPCEGEKALKDFAKEHNGQVLDQSTKPPKGDFSDTSNVTHQWTPSAMSRLATNKNELLRRCAEGTYDYIFLVDSDLLLDPTTLASLYGVQKAVVSAVYWTRWHNHPQIHAAPQVWLKPVYELSLGPYYTEQEFRHKLAERELVKVGGLGACTLIHRSVIEKGVSFAKPPDFPSGGLWDGEDRSFCEWARRLHVELWADAWPDIFHCYHPQHVVQLPEMAARLAMPHPQFPNVTHLVSLRLTGLEENLPPMFVRCRLGDNTLLPELEVAILEMQRGETKLVKVHFPSSYPPVDTNQGPMPLANQSRLVEVVLLDVKPFTLPPILEDEFYTAPGGQVKDMVELTPEQHTEIRKELA